MSELNIGTLFSIIFFIIIVIVTMYIFYLFTSCESNEEIEKVTKNKTPDINIAFLSNIGTHYLESRIVNAIIKEGQYFIYSNKNAYHVKQLKENNKVSLLIYTKVGESMKQVLLYGELEIKNETENLVLYKLNIDKRKISITVDTEEKRETYYTYEGNYGTNIVTNFNELNMLIAGSI